MAPQDVVLGMEHKDTRIMVIARRDAHRGWEEAMESDVMCVVPDQALYGVRVDLILIDLPPEDLSSERAQAWLEHVMCRLSPKGKLVYVK